MMATGSIKQTGRCEDCTLYAIETEVDRNHETPLVGQELLVLKDSGAAGSDYGDKMSKIT